MCFHTVQSVHSSILVAYLIDMASQVQRIKEVPGTRFIVDGFKFTSPFVRHYFLTHAHSDHTIGLSKSFDWGYIYCSPVTARLLIYNMGIRKDVIRPLDIDCTTYIDGVAVTPLCANHCPGAVCFLFQLTNGVSVLHTGDFRWCDRKHGGHHLLKNLQIDTLMLDTTYCNSKWVFPPQHEVIDTLCSFAQQHLKTSPKTLFVCMSYHIGKEKLYFALAERNNMKIWASESKKKVLRLLDLPEKWMTLLTDNPNDAQVHISSMRHQKYPESWEEEIRSTPWSDVILIRPTGWTFRSSLPGRNMVSPRPVSSRVQMIGIPYSEHSSFSELQSCVRTLKPRRLIPTVNAETPEKSRVLIDRLCQFMDLSRDKSRLDCYFSGNVGSSTILQKRKKSCDENSSVGVDLEAIDVEEQQKLWDQARQHRSVHNSHVQTRNTHETTSSRAIVKKVRQEPKGKSIASFFQT